MRLYLFMISLVAMAAVACVAESGANNATEKASFYTPLGLSADLQPVLLKPIHRFVPLVDYDAAGKPIFTETPKAIGNRCPMPGIGDDISYLHRVDFGLPAQREGVQGDTSGPYALKWSWSVPKPILAQHEVTSVVAVAVSSCTANQLTSLGSQSAFPNGGGRSADGYLSTGNFFWNKDKTQANHSRKFSYNEAIPSVVGGVIAIRPESDVLPQVPGFFCGDASSRDLSAAGPREAVIVAVQSRCKLRSGKTVRSEVNQRVVYLKDLPRAEGWSRGNAQAAQQARDICFGSWGYPAMCR